MLKKGDKVKCIQTSPCGTAFGVIGGIYELSKDQIWPDIIPLTNGYTVNYVRFELIKEDNMAISDTDRAAKIRDLAKALNEEIQVAETVNRMQVNMHLNNRRINVSDITKRF